MPQTFSISVIGTTPSTFDPSFSILNDNPNKVVKTYINNNLIANANSISYVIPNSVTNSVDFVLDDFKYIRTIDMYVDGVVGNIDLSKFNSIRYISIGGNNYNYTIPSVTMPTTGGHLIDYVLFYYAGLTGTLDLSKTPNINQLYLSSNPNLTSINFTYSNAPFYLEAVTTGLTGSLDLSLLDNIYNINLSSSPNIRSVILPQNRNKFRQATLTSTNIEYFDFTGSSGEHTFQINGTQFKYVTFSNNATKKPDTQNAMLFITSTGITQSLNIPNSGRMHGSLSIYSNTLLPDIVFGNTNSSNLSFNVYSNNLLKNANIDKFDGLNYIEISSNPTWSYVTFSGMSHSVFWFSTSYSGFTSLDLSMVPNIRGYGISYMSNLTNIKIGTASSVTTYSQNYVDFLYGQYLNFNNNIGLTHLDLSPRQNLMGSFNFSGNTNLRTIIHSTSSMMMRSYSAGTGLTGSLDLSPLKGLGSAISLANNTNLKRVIFPNSNRVTTLNLYGCGLTGVDLSNFNGIWNSLDISYNSNLSEYINTGSNYVFDFSGVGIGLSGSINLSSSPNIKNLYLNASPNLTNIVMATTNSVPSSLRVNNCNITGTLDLSKKFNLTGDFRAHTNPNLTSIIHASSSYLLSEYSVYSTGLTGSLDISMLTGLGGSINLYSNSNLKEIINPNTNRYISNYYAYSCNLTGTFSISGFSGHIEDIRVYNNPNLENIILPTTDKPLYTLQAYGCSISSVNFASMSKCTNWVGCSIQLQNNGMTTAEVNKILYDLDSVSESGWGTTYSRSINLSGTNAAPDNVTGWSGSSAKSSLISKGFTVSTN